MGTATAQLARFRQWGGICGCMPVVHRIREERQDGEDRLWPCCLDAFVQRIKCLHGPSRASSGVSTCCLLLFFCCSLSLSLSLSLSCSLSPLFYFLFSLFSLLSSLP